jgi:hypothetical protein
MEIRSLRRLGSALVLQSLQFGDNLTAKFGGIVRTIVESASDCTIGNAASRISAGQKNGQPESQPLESLGEDA